MRNLNPPEWSLRPARAADRDLLFEMNRLTMRGYVEAVWGWDEGFQQKFFDEHFDPDGDRQIIEVNDRPVGMVEVRDRLDDVLLVSLRVLPEWQGQGIGTAVIRSVVERATEVKKPVVLKVLRVNSRAQQLYRREGFNVDSETDLHMLMVRHPEGSRETSPRHSTKPMDG